MARKTDAHDTNVGNMEKRQARLDDEVFGKPAPDDYADRPDIDDRLYTIGEMLKVEQLNLKDLRDEKNSFRANSIKTQAGRVTMYERLSYHYEILQLCERARLASLKETCAVYVYAVPVVDKKAQWVGFGTKMSMDAACAKVGADSVYEIAAYRGGVLYDEDEPDTGEADAESGDTLSVWQCPRYAGGEAAEDDVTIALSAADKVSAMDLMSCGKHDYCEGCDGPVCIGETETESGCFQNGNSHSEATNSKNGAGDNTPDPEIPAQRPQEGGKLEKEVLDYSKDEDGVSTGEIDAFDEDGGEDTPEDDEPEGAGAA